MYAYVYVYSQFSAMRIVRVYTDIKVGAMCMYVCMHACMYVCMHMCMYTASSLPCASCAYTQI